MRLFSLFLICFCCAVVVSHRRSEGAWARLGRVVEVLESCSRNISLKSFVLTGRLMSCRGLGAAENAEIEGGSRIWG